MKLELSLLPEDWTKSKLKNIAVLISGSTPDRGRFDDYFHNGKIPWVKTLDLNNGIIKTTEEKITPKALKETSCSIIPKDSVLVAMYGGFNQIGRTGLLTIDATINQAITAITPNQKVDSKYLLHWLNNFIGTWRRFAASSRKDPNITRNDVCDFPIAFPLLPEQRRIAEIISTWDEVIENTEKLLTVKKISKRALMQRLLTGKQRFPQFAVQAWKEVKLFDIFERVTQKNEEGNTNVVTVSARRGFVRQNEFFNKFVASETLDNYFLVKKGEFCYNKSYSNGYDWGATKRLKEFDKAVVTTLYICFKFKDETKYSGDFFEHLFEAGSLDRGLTKIAHEGGRAHGLLNVTPSDFFSLKISIPAIEEQKRIAEVLSSCDKEIDLLKNQIDALKRQKRGLMQKLLTGKIRVKGEEEEIAQMVNV